MKTLSTLVLKSMLIFSLTACNTFLKFSNSTTNTQKITEAIWSATILENGNLHGRFEELTLQFSPTGRVVAKCKTCEIKGFWYEDEISNKFVMSFEPSEGLCHLNKCWDVQISGSAAVVLKSSDASEPLTLTLRVS